MAANPSAPKVLIIDDEEDMCWALAKGMQLEGFSAIVATRGFKGLALLENEHPSVILLDLKMPDMDGLEVLRRIRTADQEVPVILITGHGDMEVALQALTLGATGYMIKPFEMNDLRQAVKRVLGNQTEADA